MKYALRLIILGGMLGLLLFIGCQEAPNKQTRQIATYPHIVKGEPQIRVLTLESAQPVELLVPGTYALEITTPDGNIQKGGSDKPVTVNVSAVKEGIKLGQNIYKSAEIIPQQGNLSLRFWQVDANGKRTQSLKTFPGNYVFQRAANGKLQVIARLPLEQYLVGVLPGEMELSSAPEALKAQAVASRTYALYQIRTSTGRAYDVFPDVRSQMWKPLAQADPRARLAVNTTSGIVLTENYRIFPAYFHSDCGGTTANGKFVFSGSDITALTSCECPHASQSYKWNNGRGFTLTREALSARLAKAGIVNGRVLRIELLDENQQQRLSIGRVYFVRIFMENGIVKLIPANTFRLAVGSGKNELASTWFYAKPDPTNNVIIFNGQGYGHGVGLCQQGAKYMGAHGSDFIGILRQYYPGATLLRLWNPAAPQEQ